MCKFSLHKLTQIVSVFVALSALFCAIIGVLSCLEELTSRNKRYTEFPPEYDDYADWEVD